MIFHRLSDDGSAGFVSFIRFPRTWLLCSKIKGSTRLLCTDFAIYWFGPPVSCSRDQINPLCSSASRSAAAAKGDKNRE
jgi:hypothetical protein